MIHRNLNAICSYLMILNIFIILYHIIYHIIYIPYYIYIIYTI